MRPCMRVWPWYNILEFTPRKIVLVQFAHHRVVVEAMDPTGTCIVMERKKGRKNEEAEEEPPPPTTIETATRRTRTNLSLIHI